MDTVSKFVSEMPAIRRIELPPLSATLMATDQLDLTRKITQDGCERKQRLVIRYGYNLIPMPCIYHEYPGLNSSIKNLKNQLRLKPCW